MITNTALGMLLTPPTLRKRLVKSNPFSDALFDIIAVRDNSVTAIF
jgi:hypothetical protein